MRKIISLSPRPFLLRRLSQYDLRFFAQFNSLQLSVLWFELPSIPSFSLVPQTRQPFFFSTYQHDVHYSSISVTTLQSCSSPPKAAHFNFKVNHLSFYVLWLFSLGFRRGPPPCPFTLLIHIYTHPSLFLCYFCTLSHSLTNIYIYISIKHHSPCLIYLFILIFFFSSWTTVIFVSMLMIES